jgi:hypothetical protein
MAAPKPKGAPMKAAKTSQGPNQPKGPTNPIEDERDDLGPEDQEPNTDAEDEGELDGPGERDPQPPVDNDHVEPGAEQFDTSGPNPAAASAPAGTGSVTSVPVGSSVDPVTGRPINPVTRRPHGVDEQGRDETTGEQVVNPEPKKVRKVGDRVKDIETRWGKDIQEVLIDIHDHIFGASRPHEEVKEEQDAKKKDETK